MHHVPQLPHEDQFQEHGVGNMLSSTAYDLAWTKYQANLVSHLNRLTTGSKDSGRPTKDLLLSYARTPSKASLFNYASMAWNTHHTMLTLSPDPTPLSESLERRINNSFSSVESLKATFLATANAMFGPGFVWLVKNNNARESNPANDPQLSILATYIAGSPLPGAHYRRQPVDMNTENPQSLTEEAEKSVSMLKTTAGAFGDFSGSVDSRTPLGGANLDIMLGVCTWQHFWMGDFGIDGKMDYLSAWWDSIDWEVVEKNGQFDEIRAREAGLPSMTGRKYR